MWLMIDDVRSMDTGVIARTASAGKLMLSSYRNWQCVCFDYELRGRETGYDIMVWAIENNLLPQHVQLVTANPDSRQIMREVLVREGYKTTDGFNFMKYTDKE